MNNNTQRRLQREYANFYKNKPTDMYLFLNENNILECHFSFTGAPESDFEGGIYHGKFIFPVDYPKNPPDLYILNYNGRFAVNKKLCLTFTSYHPETWTPTWTIESMCNALRAFMLTPAEGAVGGIDSPPETRKGFAKESVSFECPQCGCKHKELVEIFAQNAKLKELEKKKQKDVPQKQSSPNQMNQLNDSVNGNESTEIIETNGKTEVILNEMNESEKKENETVEITETIEKVEKVETIQIERKENEMKESEKIETIETIQNESEKKERIKEKESKPIDMNINNNQIEQPIEITEELLTSNDSNESNQNNETIEMNDNNNNYDNYEMNTTEINQLNETKETEEKEEEDDVIAMIKKRQEMERQKMLKMLENEEKEEDNSSKNDWKEIIDEIINVTFYIAVFFLILYFLNMLKIYAIMTICTAQSFPLTNCAKSALNAAVIFRL